MSSEKEYDFETQFFEEHGRYPTNNIIVEGGEPMLYKIIPESAIDKSAL